MPAEEFSFAYGPVEVFVVEFDGDSPDAGVLDAVVELASSDTVRVLDLVIAVRRTDGSVQVTEMRESTGGAVSELVMELEGVIGDDDIAESIAATRPGFGIAILALEMLWAKTLASRVASAGGRVVRAERIAAPLVNDLVAQSLGELAEKEA